MFTIYNGRDITLNKRASAVYGQISVDFREHLDKFKNSKLNTFMGIALHINEQGWAWPSCDTLAKETGYHVGTIRKALKELCNTTVLGHHVLLRYQPIKEDGTFDSNHYLLFPTDEEVKKYKTVGVKHLANRTGNGFEKREPSCQKDKAEPSCQKPTSEKSMSKNNQIKETPNNGGNIISSQKISLLQSVGVNVHRGVKALLTKYTLDEITRCVEYGKEELRSGKDKTKVGGLVYCMLRDGVIPASKPVYGESLTVEEEPESKKELTEAEKEVEKFWHTASVELKMQMTQATWYKWLATAEPYSLEGDVFTLKVEDRYKKEWLEARLRKPIERTLSGIMTRTVTINVLVEEMPDVDLSSMNF